MAFSHKLFYTTLGFLGWFIAYLALRNIRSHLSLCVKCLIQVALQLNDTHPSIAIAEVMRVLIDEEHLDWNKAWDIVCKIFSFTTHTVISEGLEKIPVDLLGSLLPRHLQVCFINFQVFISVFH